MIEKKSCMRLAPHAGRTAWLLWSSISFLRTARRKWRRFRRRLVGLLSLHPGRHGLPIRVVLGTKLASTSVERVAAAFGRERMHQQPAVRRVTRNYDLGESLEVAPGLLFV